MDYSQDKTNNEPAENPTITCDRPSNEPFQFKTSSGPLINPKQKRTNIKYQTVIINKQTRNNNQQV